MGAPAILTLLDLIKTITNYIQNIFILGVFISDFNKYLRFPPTKFSHLSETQLVYYHNLSRPTSFNVFFFEGDICCCDCCCIVSVINQFCFGVYPFW